MTHCTCMRYPAFLSFIIWTIGNAGYLSHTVRDKTLDTLLLLKQWSSNCNDMLQDKVVILDSVFYVWKVHVPRVSHTLGHAAYPLCQYKIILLGKYNVKSLHQDHLWNKSGLWPLFERPMGGILMKNKCCRMWRKYASDHLINDKEKFAFSFILPAFNEYT